MCVVIKRRIDYFCIILTYSIAGKSKDTVDVSVKSAIEQAAKKAKDRTFTQAGQLHAKRVKLHAKRAKISQFRPGR